LSKFLYKLFISAYLLLLKLASPFNPKAKLWIKGRQGIFESMRRTISKNDAIVWMHCSSLGEFEQGRPALERLRTDYPAYKILLTFFSPSGYEVRKNYSGADYIFYLPMDSRKNAVLFFDIINPRLIIYVKYEFWYYYLAEAKKRNIPLLLISAIFRKTQPFFSGYGNFHRTMLSCFTHLFVQNAASVSLLHSIKITNVSLAGDTRFDRVVEITENVRPISSIEAFCVDSDVIVAGSTWTEDDKELAHYANTRSKVKFIIAPHNIGKDRLDECGKLYKHSALFSSIKSTPAARNINTIIIDNIGMLSTLYKYATVTYVGGGFGSDGVHNVLEAAVYGKPVVFGPEYKKFIEAAELIESGGGISIKNALELEDAFDNLLLKDENYISTCTASRHYVENKQGATEKICQFIQANRLLTN